MRIKFLGEWYDIQCFNITKNGGTAFITKDYENSIEDIEINGRHLATDKDVATKTEAVEPQDNKPTEKVGGYEYTHICVSDKPEVGEEVVVMLNGTPTKGVIKSIQDEVAEVGFEGTSYAVFRSFDELNTGIATASEIREHSITPWHEQKEIDWEQRRWDLACRLSIRYHGKERRDAEEIIHFVDVLIDEYRKEVKL
jgi:hypothetical protein